MKKLFVVLSVISLVYLLIGCEPKKIDDNYEISPLNPKSGEEISVLYDAEKTDLKESKSIDLIVYSFNVEIESSKLYKMEKDGNLWTAKITPEEGVKGIILKFEDSNNYKIVDANDQKGYMVPMYTKDGEPMPCAEAGFAYGLVSWAPEIGLEVDKETSLSKIEKVLSENPEMKVKHLAEYFYILHRVKREDAFPIIKEELDKTTKIDSLDGKTYAVAAEWYSKIGDKESADKFLNILTEKFPKKNFTLKILANKILDKKDHHSQIKALLLFQQKYPEFTDWVDIKTQLVYGLFNNGYDRAAAKFLIDNQNDILSPYFFFIAEKLSKKSPKIFGKAIYPPALANARKELEAPTKQKPKNLTNKEWLQERKNSVFDYLICSGSVALALENYDEALKFYNEGMEVFENLPEGKFSITPDHYINHVKAYVKNAKIDEAKNLIEHYVINGQGSEDLFELMKEIYTTKNGSEEGYTEYLGKFEAAAEQAMLAKLSSELISIPAPDFKLQALDGKEVSLSDYKGKTVIVDFWATWCGPCLRSFPAMQTAVNDFADDKNVEFLFVNTWERVENKLENASNFIKKNNYNFNVLLDTANVAVAKFKVNGIPNKFVVDKDGNIRFNKSGYDGNLKHTVDEIKAMVSLVQ